MSDEKLNLLVNDYPEYSEVIKAISDWFREHADQRAIRMDEFYSNQFGFSIEDVNAAFMLMRQQSMLKTIYRVLDDDGSKIGKDFENYSEIPDEVSTIWGVKKETKDVFVVPFYSLLH
ncbi:hypothetical protein [Maribacter sp. 2-571]|uniref:hypothetical protein n=1 Tax=Maribacter sp. 2-571 TaxID=3417569 RepID=UPI003D358E4C